jgi:alkanesulfonate monooxygenase SsuD/methylene tetrahydromethanopterin reductase-like flavin-dependent oxidoreductase (luciferase family)
MKIDMFCEVEKARPWGPNHEYELLRETLAQAKLADKMGYDCWWEVEHHTWEEGSYSSAPEILLTAISQHTQRMRIGHGVILTPHKFIHPIRIAERTSTLDLLSDGRLEVGFGRSTIPEWRLFGIDPDETREQLEESMRMVPEMWTQDRFTYKSANFEINDRAIIPKPLQKPHPPMWMASTSQNSFEMAGHLGVGVLGVTLLTPLEAMAGLLQSYREAIRTAKPAGKFVNEQTAVFTFVHCADSIDQAIANGAAEAAAWYINTIQDFFELRQQRERQQREIEAKLEKSAPADAAGEGLRTGLANPKAAPGTAPQNPAAEIIARLNEGDKISGGEIFDVLGKEDSMVIGDPETIRKKMSHYRDAGVDRLLCFQQVGGLPHSAIMKSIQMIGEEVIPYFSPK